MIKEIVDSALGMFYGMALQDGKSAGMGFSVGAPAEIGQGQRTAAGPVERRFVQTGDTYAYSIGSGAVTWQEMKLMAVAKTRVRERIADADSHSHGFFTKASDLANEALNELGCHEEARWLSYLIAHDMAGYGPISILLEDRDNIAGVEVKSAFSPILVLSKNHGRCLTNLRFAGEEAFRSTMNRFVLENGRGLGQEGVEIDVRIRDAIPHALAGPYAGRGPAASIMTGRNMGAENILLDGTASPDVIAYLWIALESRMNVIVSGGRASGKSALISALAGFLPRHSRLAVIGNRTDEPLPMGPLFCVASVDGSGYGNIDTGEQVAELLGTRPDRMIFGEVRGREAAALFSGANEGVPFITTVRSDEGGLSLPVMLNAKPICIGPVALSMLDLSVHMMRTDPETVHIASISEYLWLSRAETECGSDIGNGDSVEELPLLEYGTFGKNLERSKVLKAYSRMMGVGIAYAVAEQKARADAIRKALDEKDSRDGLKRLVSHHLGLMSRRYDQPVE